MHRDGSRWSKQSRVRGQASKPHVHHHGQQLWLQGSLHPHRTHPVLCQDTEIQRASGYVWNVPQLLLEHRSGQEQNLKNQKLSCTRSILQQYFLYRLSHNVSPCFLPLKV